MAGGLGTRLRPITDKVPKCLVPIGGRPLLDYWLDRFAEAGLRDILINTHHLPEQVRRYAEAVNASGRCRIHEFYEPNLLGSGGTVHANRDWVPNHGECLIVYADNLSNVNLADLLMAHRRMRSELTMLLFRSPTPEKCGIAQLDQAGLIVAFQEKPAHPTGNLANAGVYVASATAFHEMADLNAFDLGFHVLPAFVGRMHGWAFDGYHRDIGTMESLRQAEADVAAGLVRRLPSLAQL